MTVYSTTISTSPTSSAEEAATSITSERINDHAGSNFISSEDFNNGGVQVIDGKSGDRKSVYSAADLDPTDIVNVEGIPMTVAQAKAAGVNINIEAKAKANEAGDGLTQVSNGEPEADPVDTRTEEDGHATDGELVAMENATAAVALHTGLSQDAAIELGVDILNGEIPQGDEIWTGLQAKGISQQAAFGTINQVVQIGQDAARRELGEKDYNELNSLASNSKAIRDLVIKHGVQRMTGNAKGVTYKQVLTLARQFAAR